jgi:hypothetical protein
MQVDQATRCRDENVDAAPELPDLRLDPDTTVNDRARLLRILAVDAHTFRDLRGELARGSKNQHPHRPATAGVRRDTMGHEPLQNRQYESCGLASAGLRAGEQVTSGENGGNRLGLDRRWHGIAVFGDCAHQFRGQAEICE